MEAFVILSLPGLWRIMDLLVTLNIENKKPTYIQVFYGRSIHIAAA